MIVKNIIKFITFCFVGVTSALIHLGVFNLFFFILNNVLNKEAFLFGASRSYIIATALAITVSIVYNFSMNRNITFSARGESIKKQIPRYATIYFISIAVNFIVSLIIITFLGENTINANIATFAGIIAGIPISFLGSLLWTFKNN